MKNFKVECPIALAIFSLIFIFVFSVRQCFADKRTCKALDVGSRKQLFIDDKFIESSKGVQLMMNQLQRTGQILLKADAPWKTELGATIGFYCSLIKEGNKIRLRDTGKHTRGNRFAYLDSREVWYPDLSLPKFITAQWIDEPNIEAAVILSMDDMVEPEPFQKVLEPVFARLKQVCNGKNPYSIFSNRVNPNHHLFQQMINDGVCIETHSYDHPFGLFNIKEGLALNTGSAYQYLASIDSIGSIPNCTPIAFRMPCGDAMNTVTPRFYSELFNRISPGGRFLKADSSLFNIFTADDPQLDREWVVREDGKGVFTYYIQFPLWFNYMENYPYPYIIEKTCIELPMFFPCDYDAFRKHGKYSPLMNEVWNKGLDATVRKKGLFILVRHCYLIGWDWSKPEQAVEFIDYAVEKYGDKIKFINIQQAVELIEQNAFGGTSIKSPDGKDNGVRLLDLNADGYMDVVIGNSRRKLTRVYQPDQRRWKEVDFPTQIVDDQGREVGVKFLEVQANGYASIVIRNDSIDGLYHFNGNGWINAGKFTNSVNEKYADRLYSAKAGIDRGLRCRDINNDGFSDLIFNNNKQSIIYIWSPDTKKFNKATFALPGLSQIVDAAGHDEGLRFYDINKDGHLDIVLSNDSEYYVRIFKDMESGWSNVKMQGKASDENRLPPIVTNHTVNGAWFRGQMMYIGNEHTGHIPCQVIQRSLVEPQKEK